ncbi:MAG: 3-methyl-2-oxobutanoate dehydrogenase subunit VorB [Oscillospiraceae bacterium]|nr:3-methyl-2-oxobutanoate dehydrogenase subunit VorB [Oscillospiraceae bacterium]
MARVLMKGCEAIAEAAVRAGCRFFAGYPITPQNEIPEYFARRLPEVGGTFVQGESEVASVNMVYGAAAAGTRSMTSSSSPGIALKSEGISYCAAARIPIVYANISRGGPGVGAIQPAQQDYLQATKASGNGGFEMIVLAPSTVQEAADLTYAAFNYADRDRNPVLILADGVIGTMMEPVELPEMKTDEEIATLKAKKAKWACTGHKLDYANRSWIQPGQWNTQIMQAENEKAAALYAPWEKDIQVEEYMVEDAEVVIAAYGVCARIGKSAVDLCRAAGKKVGLIRPITVHPFPFAAFDHIDYNVCKAVLDVEMSIPAQLVQDVRMGVKGRCPIETCLCSGGNIMSREAVLNAVDAILSK